MSLFLVRHGAPTVVAGSPPHEWPLDPASYDAVWALRDRVPARAAWFSSPEPKALSTAHLLTDGSIGVVEPLREHHRDSAVWFDDFPAQAHQAFESPEVSTNAGWEPLEVCRARVTSAARPLLEAHRGEDVVMVGHGTAWTLLVSDLTGLPPDLERWAAMAMPDVIVLEQRDDQRWVCH